jgi:hypothetical protein
LYAMPLWADFARGLLLLRRVCHRLSDNMRSRLLRQRGGGVRPVRRKLVLAGRDSDVLYVMPLWSDIARGILLLRRMR